MTALAKLTRSQALSPGLVPTGMEQAMQLADLMCRAKMLPSHFHNSPGDTLMVIEQAMRWNMSPFAVAQEAMSIKGKMMYSGKIIAAAIENSGAIEGYLDYEFAGSGPERSVTVTATRRGETSPKSVTVTVKEAQTDNAWWKKTPDQMLVYHGARVWGRRWTPAVILGVYAPEEFGQIIEGEAPVEVERVAPLQAARDLRDSIPHLDAPAPDPVATIAERLAKCASAADVLRVGEVWGRTVTRAADAGRPMSSIVVDEVQSMMAERYGAFQAPIVDEVHEESEP